MACTRPARGGVLRATVVALTWLAATALCMGSDLDQGPVARREAGITQLVTLLETEQVFTDRPEEAEEAVVALGQLRAEAAVPVLVERLFFAPHTRFGTEMLADYPCAVALCRVGSPAAPVLVKRMAGDDEALWLGTQALLYIDGPQVARARLHLAMGAELREDRAQRLRRAMDELDGGGVPSVGYDPADTGPPPAHPAAIEREGAIAELLAVLKTERIFEDDPDRAEEAVVALGHLRAAAAVGVLAANLPFEPHPPFCPDGLQDFPCAVALVRIGSAAAPGLLEVMPTDDDRTWLGYQALAHIDGPQLASVRLRMAAQSVTDGAGRARLEAAAEYVLKCGLSSLEPRKRK